MSFDEGEEPCHCRLARQGAILAPPFFHHSGQYWGALTLPLTTWTYLLLQGLRWCNLASCCHGMACCAQGMGLPLCAPVRSPQHLQPPRRVPSCQGRIHYPPDWIVIVKSQLNRDGYCGIATPFHLAQLSESSEAGNSLPNWDKVGGLKKKKKKKSQIWIKIRITHASCYHLHGKTAAGNESSRERFFQAAPSFLPAVQLGSLKMASARHRAALHPPFPLGLSTYWASITTPLVTEISWGRRGDYAVRPPTLSQAVAFHFPTLRLSHGHPRDEVTDKEDLAFAVWAGESVQLPTQFCRMGAVTPDLSIPGELWLSSPRQGILGRGEGCSALAMPLRVVSKWGFPHKCS